MMTQRINPSIPIPSIVKHACITAIIAAAVASDFHVERCLTRAPLRFPGLSFMASRFLMWRFYNNASSLALSGVAPQHVCTDSSQSRRFDCTRLAARSAQRELVDNL